jgi:hypothetical protein
MKGSNRGFFTEVDANTYKSGCEWFQNIQKRMRTVLAKALGHCAGLTPSGGREKRGLMVNGWNSQKRGPVAKAFFGHVMNNAAFRSIVEHS